MSATSPYSILVVDSEQKTLKYFYRLFGKKYTIYAAQNGEEATNLLSKYDGSIGVLMTADRVAGKTGVELIKQAKLNNSNVVVIYSSVAKEKGVELCKHGAAFRYIIKPWSINELCSYIDQAMDFFISNNGIDRHG